MPLDKSIKKTLVIGSGPIVIGQAAEFDYAGTQACRVLREDNIEIVLVNSNPATIMTDNASADSVYIEPLTLKTIKRIIEKERPDSILSGMGGQTGLTICMQLAKDGFLDKMGVKLLGTSPEAIDKAEDRQIFKDTMEEIGQPVIPSVIANDINTAQDFVKSNGFPVIIRPAFTLGGSGGGIVYNDAELIETVRNGLALSPINQVLVEKCVSGWKEIEFEVIRDKKGTVITVCSMENFDPVGIHTGDSIVIAPAVTLSDKEYQMLRTAALDIISALGIEGGCNCQFALEPNSFEYAVIEVNPRVSRSSALASKATGYPIAKVATKIAIGYTLDEIVNNVTGTTYAAFEPALDYVTVKFPKWPFDKFVYAQKDLGTQMKATGEVMSIGDSFELAILKAVRGAELGLDTLSLPRLAGKTDEKIRQRLHNITDERIFVIYEALKRGISVDDIHDITKIDRWFINKLANILNCENKLKSASLATEDYLYAKQIGFTDKAIKRFTGSCPEKISPAYKMVDTCGGEFAASTPYFYGIFGSKESGTENEATPIVANSKKERVLVLGSGPIRIGQGIEFDYASVHCVWSLKKAGYEVIVINNNPETVSTDFDTADRLYFESLHIEDVMNVIEIEKPIGVVVAFGGGTAIKLTKELSENGVRIIGTSAEAIDTCEDRERFDALLENLNIKRPKGYAIMTEVEALKVANELQYPVLMRPSYVLGGQNMIIAYEDEDIKEYMEVILRQKQDNPVLIDKYLSGMEIEVDSICDGEDILIPGIMEHIERTGVHSGDSIAVYPAPHITDDLAQEIFDVTKRICLALDVRGLVNIQYVISNGAIYVIEVNPRASRTVPYISKVTGVAMCDIATQVSLGGKLPQTGIAKIPPYTAVKVPVFSFEKLIDVDTHLGPEMKSTGEVLGLGKNLQEALYKGIVGAGYKMLRKGGVFLSVSDADKGEISALAKKFATLGFSIYATQGTSKILEKAGLEVSTVKKIHESTSDNTSTLLSSGLVDYIVSTSTKGRDPVRDSVKIRRRAISLGIPCLTSLDTANAVVDSLLSHYSEINTELVDINNMRQNRMLLNFTKMHGCGNDYIYINCFDQTINSPESLSVFLADRHFGVGGDGVVLILPSKNAAAKMRVFNLDGSESEMCGNAIRCIAKYLYDSGLVKDTEFQIETNSGLLKDISLKTRNSKASFVKVNIGRIELDPKKIPVNLFGDSIINTSVKICDKDYKITCLSLGNPHCVVFTDDLDSLNLVEIGPEFETNELFPERVNAGFVKIVDEKTIRLRTWERGSGETLACGSSAGAAAVAAILNGYCKENANIRVILAGGELTVNYNGRHVFLSGECHQVFEGSVKI